MAYVVGFLSDDGVVGVVAVEVASRPVLLVAAHMGMSGVLARHEARPGRCRHGTSGIGLCEAHAFASHAVDVRCGDVALSVAGQVAVSHIVAHDVDDVRAFVGRSGEGRCRKGKGGGGNGSKVFHRLLMNGGG